MFGVCQAFFLHSEEKMEDCRTEERRRFKRYPLYCPIQYNCEEHELEDPSITLNISEGGALISTRKPIEKTSVIKIKIALEHKHYTLEAKAVHIHPEMEKGLYSVGLEFIDRPSDFRDKFYEEVDAIISYQARCSLEAETEVSLAEASMKWYGNPVRWF